MVVKVFGVDEDVIHVADEFPTVRDGARSSVAGVGEHWDRPYA